jgi:hypothetical protein
MKEILKHLCAVSLGVGLAGCAPVPHQGMILDQKTGISWGSTVEHNILLDATQLANRKVNVSIRNVSGDEAYDIQNMKSLFGNVLSQKGYSASEGEGFGIKFDVNVVYSGQIRKDMTAQYAFLGGATGAVAGYGGSYQFRNALGGAIAGATLGGILGSYVGEDTYVVIVDVAIAVIDQNLGTTSRTITFSSSPATQEKIRSNVKPYEQVLRTKIAVYAGGRNLQRDQIIEGVRRRITNIVNNIV